MDLKTVVLTLVAMVAFAANSLLCRAALATGEIDAASFTSIRLLSGATLLALLVYTKKPTPRLQPRRVLPALMLFGYAILFSYAYVSLTAATGALLLFGAVQMTMIVFALATGDRPKVLQIAGYLVALLGLIYLLIPGVAAPPLMGSVMMVLSGVAWGAYSILGRSAENPITDTANNFIKTVPFAFVLGAMGFRNLSSEGVLLAVISGAVTSGIGYAVWYTAIKGLTGTQAASVQLSVPVIAAIGAVALLSEPLTLRLTVASFMILGGIAITLRPSQS